MDKRGLVSMDKKGQNITIGTLILIVLGIVVLVLLIIGFTVGWDFIIDKFKVAPGQTLEAVVQSCKFSANNDLKTDFCGFKELKVEGDNQHINCLDSRVRNAIEGDVNVNLNAFCENFDGPKDYCERKGLKESALINGASCILHGSNIVDGVAKLEGLTCEEVGEKDNDGKTSTQWREVGQCEKESNDDDNNYDSVPNSEINDISTRPDEPDKNYVCCKITAP